MLHSRKEKKEKDERMTCARVSTELIWLEIINTGRGSMLTESLTKVEACSYANCIHHDDVLNGT